MPSLSENDQSYDPHLAALDAVNIVTRVLDEAQDIVNTAIDSGQSWRYVWRQKSQAKNVFYENDEILGIIKCDDKDTTDSDLNKINNIIVTSTPQKETEDIIKCYNENNLIGQGDEDIQNRNNEMRSPTMLINSLFDMSELEDSVAFDTNEDLQGDLDSPDFYAGNIAELVESYVNFALNTARDRQLCAESIAESNNSSYSLLSDVSVIDVIENIKFCTESAKNDFKKDHNTATIDTTVMDNVDVEEYIKKDIELYGKTFSTLNRDYEKFSEDEEHILQDQKSLTMQNVELYTNISSENLALQSDQKTITQEEPVTKAQVCHKKSLVKRCRQQGAKLMARLRVWWWRQRLIGKRKESRSGLVVPGICPLTPNARTRAASLLDHRKLRSPPPLHTLEWKFNTVNEAIIYSYNRNNSEMEMNSSDPRE